MKRFKKDISSNSMIKLSAGIPPAKVPPKKGDFQLRDAITTLDRLTQLVDNITPKAFKMFGKIAEPGLLKDNYFINTDKKIVPKPPGLDINNQSTWGKNIVDVKLTQDLLTDDLVSSSKFPKSSLVMFGGLTTLMISAKFMLGLESFGFLDGVLLSLPSLLSSAILYKMNTDDLKSVKSLLETSKNIRVIKLPYPPSHTDTFMSEMFRNNPKNFKHDERLSLIELKNILNNGTDYKWTQSRQNIPMYFGKKFDNEVYFFTPETISDLNKIQKTVSVKIARYALAVGIPLATLAGGLAMKKSNEPPKAAAGSETKSETIPRINFDPSTDGGRKWAEFNKKRKSKLEESTKKRTQQWFNNF